MFNRADKTILRTLLTYIVVKMALHKIFVTVSDCSGNFVCLYYINKELTK